MIIGAKIQTQTAFTTKLPLVHNCLIAGIPYMVYLPFYTQVSDGFQILSRLSLQHIYIDGPKGVQLPHDGSVPVFLRKPTAMHDLYN